MKKNEKIRILIADDHAFLRQGIKQILSETPDMVVVAEAGNGHEVLELIRKTAVDVLVMDISMPEKTGWDVLLQMKSEKINVPVIILSVSPEDNYAVTMLRAGASGYIAKSSAPELLVEAIRKVANGGKFISPHLAEKMVFDLSFDCDKRLHETLSPRELQVLILIATGKTVSEIAEELALSVPTVSTHRSRILEKMNMTSNAQLTHYAIKNNLA
jgi:DNA-binding NarL/FixJ family response regulator